MTNPWMLEILTSEDHRKGIRFVGHCAECDRGWTAAPADPATNGHAKAVPPQGEYIAQRARINVSPLIPLPDFLDQPDLDVEYRVDRLWTTGGRFLLAAQHKAGKTIARDNVVRALVDGTPLFGEFAVTPLEPDRTVVVVDDELDERMLRRWMRDQGIAHPERVMVAPLRGKLTEFNLLDPDVMTQWQRRLSDANAGVLILDCLRPVLDSIGLDEARDAGRFLVALDALLVSAGVTEAGVIHHMGHDAKRSRGDSRLRDWPDVEWIMTRPADSNGDEDMSGPRYFRAFGRGVDVPERRLDYDPRTRHLRYTDEKRGMVEARRDNDAVMRLVAQHLATGPSTKNGIAAGVKARRMDVFGAVERGIQAGLFTVTSGPNRAQVITLNRPTDNPFAGDSGE